MVRTLLPILLVSGALAAAAQTGRIAHFSHSGSAANLIEGRDNFGIPPSPEFIVDSIRYVSASKVVEYGKWDYGVNTSKERIILLPQKMSPVAALHYLQQHPELRVEEYHPDRPDFEVKYLGFELPNRSIPLRKLKEKPKKPANRTQTFSKRPFQYSYWREISSITAVGAVGWLLGKKNPA